MAILVDITGKRSGSLVVVRYAEHRSGRAYWICQCDCGNTCVKRGDTLDGRTISCGCRQGGEAKIHGHTWEGGETPTYRSWHSMLTRCRNPNHDNYPSYGGRGIKVCERWESFDLFLADMGERPDGTTLDRYPDRNGNYEPGNVRWATTKEQSRNRDSVRLTAELAEAIRSSVKAGESQADVSRRLGVHSSIVNRIVNGKIWR